MMDHIEVRRRTYHDSVRLMQASAAVQKTPGVELALISMATDLNLGLLEDLHFDVPGDTVPDDMIVAIRVSGEDVVPAAMAALDAALVVAPASGGGMLAPPQPHLLSSAARAADLNLGLISVPGPHAFVEAADALRAGLNVMIFSDNVPVEQEIALKRLGVEKDLIVMGPDCGTAIVGGIGLGFANAVRPGPVGIVGASGTGTQHISCLLDDAGVGISHALGTGSRDLSTAVGAIATLQGLAALDADPATEVIVIVSKPPAPEIAAKVRKAAAACSTPTVVCMIGEETLEAGAANALAVLGIEAPPARSWPAIREGQRPGTIKGLFSGGTLRDEARMVLAALMGDAAAGLEMIDFGDDEYTRGRPHPMIDQRLRLEHLATTASDESVGVALIDVVLGYGAHADPASELAPVIAEAVDAGLAVVVSLCGAQGDPQGRDRQAAALNEAGAAVFSSNAAAATHAHHLMQGGVA
ncbi:MAG: FdrA family protein [Acidimicrobiia bacterium]|nr:FdrA family protein [Acidimicrobiia bacterium]